MGQVKGCHLVGSVCLPDAETVFRQCSASMPNRLKRIPDGETGERQFFVQFQTQQQGLGSVPEMLVAYADNSDLHTQDVSPQAVSEAIEKVKQIGIKTGYDDAAIKSYADFKRLRDDGAIPKATRFQVSLPSYSNTMGLVHNAFATAVAPLYEEALLRDMRKIQDSIPHADLAIQIDLAVDYMLLEKCPFVKPWVHNGEDEEALLRQYIVGYIVRMISQIDQDVEVGLHNCYGDMGHQHWKEPESLGNITEHLLAIFEQTPRPINFVHFPVPLSAMDKLETYYSPFKQVLPKLREHDTELYLGLVHYDDLKGTKDRIEAAQKAFGDVDFGVATECGWGRTPQGEIENIMKISSEVSEPVF